MTDTSDMDDFESITSGASNAAPEIQQEPQTTTQPSRDDGGRFASPQAKQPAAVTQPTPETPAATAEQPQPNGNGNVPVGAVQAEREKRQEAQHRAADLERQLAELRGQVTLLSQQRQPTPQPQEQKAPITLWDDPDAFLGSQLTPITQQMQEMREELWESRAASVHTPEAVQAAKAAAEKLFGTPEGKVLHQQITAAGGNPFDNLVKWHKQQEALAKVGSDPDAWLNAELEKRMNDPEFLAQATERARANATSNANRSQPLTNIPPSLSRLPAGGNLQPETDASDGALFTSLTSGRR
jgi:hypothetical protein